MTIKVVDNFASLHPQIAFNVETVFVMVLAYPLVASVPTLLAIPGGFLNSPFFTAVYIFRNINIISTERDNHYGKHRNLFLGFDNLSFGGKS